MLQTLIPVSRGGTRVIDPQMGIKIAQIWYWADEFAGRRNTKKTVEVRVDMWNVCVAYACIDGRWVKCVSKLLMQFRQLTQIELRYALYAVRLRLRAVPADSFESVLREVVAEHNIPAVADVTGATRLVYGRPQLTEIDAADGSQGTEEANHADNLMESRVSASQSEESVEETPTTTYRRRSGNPTQPPSPPDFGRFKVDYSHLPVRHSI